MADIVEAMLRGVTDVFQANDRRRVGEISRMDDGVDGLHRAIKLYLTRISRDGFDDEASRRYSDVLSFAINLEHIGDIIDKNLMELAAKRASVPAWPSRPRARKRSASCASGWWLT